MSDSGAPDLENLPDAQAGQGITSSPGSEHEPPEVSALPETATGSGSVSKQRQNADEAEARDAGDEVLDDVDLADRGSQDQQQGEDADLVGTERSFSEVRDDDEKPKAVTQPMLDDANDGPAQAASVGGPWGAGDTESSAADTLPPFPAAGLSFTPDLAHSSAATSGTHAAGQQLAAYTHLQVIPSDSSSAGPNFYTITAVSQASGEATCSRRRFADLVAMHETLKRAFRGCVIPFRPGKTLANSTAIRSHGEGFLKERAFAIKLYLSKVVRHPEIKDTEVLRQFMENEGVLQQSEDWQREQPRRVPLVVGVVQSMRKMAGAESRIPTPSQVSQGTGKSELDLVRQMAELRVDRKALHADADEAERALLDLGDRLPEWIKANQGLAAAASGLVDTARSVLESMADNGRGLMMMCKFEREWAGPRELHVSEAAITALSSSVDALGRCCGDGVKSALMRQMVLLSPINDHAFMLPRLEKALAARLDARVVLESLRRQEAVINAAFAQLHAKEMSGTMTNADVRRMNRARAEVDQVAQAREAGEGVYGRLRARNERDIAAYRCERCERLAGAVVRYADAQAATNEVIGDLWLGLAHRLGADTAAAGHALETLDLAALGPQVSHSAGLVAEGRYVDAGTGDGAAAVAAAAGPLPTEHAAVM